MRALPILLLVTSCSVDVGDVGVAPVTIRPLPPVDVDAGIDESSSNAQARAELIAALAATSDFYEFETTVTIDDSVTMQVTGEVTGETAETRVARGGSVLEYVRNADGHWVLDLKEPRLPVDQVATGPAPLDGLVDSPALVVDHADREGSVLRAVYAGGAVGVPEVDEIAVSLTIQNGTVRRVRYDVPVEGSTAHVVTVISSGTETRPGPGREIHAAE